MIPETNISTATLIDMSAEIAADSTLFSARLATPATERVGFSDLFAAACGGNLVSDHYRFALEYIFEGYLLHYRESRLLAPDVDDFNLLAGDYMYARGLVHVADLEDLYCVQLLADLVSVCSAIHCRDADPGLSFNAWASATLCIAARASGRGSECLPALEAFRENVLSGADGDTGSILQTLLSDYPGKEDDRLRKMLAAIHDVYW